MSPGYRNESQNVGTFVAGELNSGDVAYTDADGRMYNAGRSKDLIIRSAHNIDPLMIENPLQRHPAVALATEEELRTFAEAKIGERPAWPKEIRIIDAIPMTAVGKIFKPSLRENAAKRTVRTVLVERHLAGDVVAGGGLRAMSVTVTLADSNHDDASQLQEILDGYLFQTTIKS